MLRRSESLLAAAACLLLAAAAPGEPARWYGIFASDGSRIGHAAREVVERPGGREIVESYTIRIQEEDQPPTAISGRTVRREDRRGRTLSIAEEARNGARSTRIQVVVRAGRAEATRRTGASTDTESIALAETVRFDDGEGLLARWNPEATPRLEFDAFNASAMSVDHVVVEALRGAARDSAGRLPVLRRRYERGELRGISRLLIDRAGAIVEIEQPMFGGTIRWRAIDRQAALRPATAYSALRAALIRAPYRLTESALEGHLRYRFGYRDGISFPLPRTGEQRAAAAPDGVTLDICGACGPGLATDPATLADALRPTAWLQSGDRRLRAIAEPVARLAISGTRKMEMLRARTEPYLARIDFTGHFSALETLSRRAGDCTEAAVLLAALGRAAGIPTRVASGLVYSRQRYHGVSNVFIPHSWVLAYVDGRWRSFDAALGQFDATHIALTIGDGDARSIAAAGQLAGLLEWQEMSEVRPRPSP
ncbi:MAG TPA: transglutaminase-like domain-containing protein [Allosphingosinicella sp.]